MATASTRKLLSAASSAPTAAAAVKNVEDAHVAIASAEQVQLHDKWLRVFSSSIFAHGRLRLISRTFSRIISGIHKGWGD